MVSVSSVWLEITGTCQLECTHCYADPGPTGDHGVMDERTSRKVIDQSRKLGAKMVRFIVTLGVRSSVRAVLPSGLRTVVLAHRGACSPEGGCQPNYD